MKIMLDAGHGGKDSGAIGNGLYEKNIVLAIAKKIETLLEKDYQNVEVIMTRSTDEFFTLEERSKRANLENVDIFLSIHCNSFTSTTPRGFETHVYLSPDAKTQAFQNVMHSEIMKEISTFTGVQDRGKRQSNFHVLRETKMTAILSECLFVSNTQDANLLKSDAFLNKIAQGHVNGLAKFLGLTKKPVTPPTPTPVNETLYQVIVGTFRDRENAEDLLQALKNDGYNGYIFTKE